VNVRLLTLADEVAYRTILSRTSDEDRYYRFFRPVDSLDADDVHRFVEPGPDLVGLIAESAPGGEPLGTAHGALLPGGRAELAIIVAAGARERGVGKTLMTALITHLRERGYHRIVAHSLQENVAFARLAQSLGMRIERTEGADVLWSLSLPRAVAPREPATSLQFPLL
jgi:RimJ/RimL family protein N-acetyltransferase